MQLAPLPFRFPTRARFGALAVAAVLAACGSHAEVQPAAGTAPLSEADTRAFRACTSAADCVYARNGCCDCANGGEAIAVNREQLAAFRARFACGEIVCKLMGADPGCETGNATCEQGMCRYQLSGMPKR